MMRRLLRVTMRDTRVTVVATMLQALPPKTFIDDVTVRGDGRKFLMVLPTSGEPTDRWAMRERLMQLEGVVDVEVFDG
jgi:hypothetical protein